MAVNAGLDMYSDLKSEVLFGRTKANNKLCAFCRNTKKFNVVGPKMSCCASISAQTRTQNKNVHDFFKRPMQIASVGLVFGINVFWAQDGLVRVNFGVGMHSKQKCTRSLKDLGK